MRSGGGWASQRHWMVVVPLLALALLITACDAGGSQPVPGEATRSTSTPTGTSTGANLPDALLTEVLSTAGTATPAAIPTSLSEDDRQTIFGLVVLNLVKAESATTVYLNPFLGQGERLDETDPAKSLGDGLGKYMDAVDGERQYFMSGFSEAVGALEEGGKVKDSGVFVTLGEIMSGPEGTGIVAVRGTIYRGLGNAAGYLYSFQPDATAPDGWKLLDVQQEWSDN